MFNIVDIQNSFYLFWVDRLFDSKDDHWKAVPRYFYQDVGGLSCFYSNVTSQDFKGINLINNDFWKLILNIQSPNRGLLLV